MFIRDHSAKTVCQNDTRCWKGKSLVHSFRARRVASPPVVVVMLVVLRVPSMVAGGRLYTNIRNMDSIDIRCRASVLLIYVHWDE